MNVTGAGPTPQYQFELGAKIEKQSADPAVPAPAATPGAPTPAAATAGPGNAPASQIQPPAPTSDAAAAADKPAREPGVGSSVDVSA